MVIVMRQLVPSPTCELAATRTPVPPLKHPNAGKARASTTAAQSVAQAGQSAGRAAVCQASAETLVPAALEGPQESLAAPAVPAPAQLLVVAGDVEAGSSVSSEGSICILGRLSGSAHAGSSGDRSAVIRAQRTDTSDVTIGDVRASERLRLAGPTLIVCTPEGSLALRPQPGAVRPRASAPLLQTPASQAPPHEQPAVDASSSATDEGLAAAAEPPAAPAKAVRKARRKTAGGKRAAAAAAAAADPPKLQPLSLSALRGASPAAKTALVTGVYITGLGLALIYRPVATFGLLFDTQQVGEAWIRVGGVLCCLFGSYYLGAAHGELSRRQLRSFYWSTVWGRVFLSGAFATLVCLQQAEWPLLLPAALNLLGAFSMQRAVKRS